MGLCIPGSERIAKGIRSASAEARQGIAVDSPDDLAAGVELEPARVAAAIAEEGEHRQERVLARTRQREEVVRRLPDRSGPVGDPVGETIEITHLASFVRESFGFVQNVDFREVTIGHGMARHARLAERTQHQVQDAIRAVGVLAEKEQRTLAVAELRSPPDPQLHAVRGEATRNPDHQAALADRALERALHCHQVVGDRPVGLGRRQRPDHPRHDHHRSLIGQVVVVDQPDAGRLGRRSRAQNEQGKEQREPSESSADGHEKGSECNSRTGHPKLRPGRSVVNENCRYVHPLRTIAAHRAIVR